MGDWHKQSNITLFKTKSYSIYFLIALSIKYERSFIILSHGNNDGHGVASFLKVPVRW